jgi:hypothetical protein
MEVLIFIIFFAISIIHLRDFVYFSYSLITLKPCSSWTFSLLGVKSNMNWSGHLFLTIVHFNIFILFLKSAMDLLH